MLFQTRDVSLAIRPLDEGRIHVRLTHKPSGLSVEGDGAEFGPLREQLEKQLQTEVMAQADG
jgi:hypothetical protein